MLFRRFTVILILYETFILEKSYATRQSLMQTKRIPRETDGQEKENQNHKEESHFNYKHSNHWQNNFPMCSGQRQSPINIELQDIKTMDSKQPPLGCFGYDARPLTMNIINNGHSVQLTGEWPTKNIPSVRGGPLIGLYELAQVHFHWGAVNQAGSEHTVSNHSFPLEMHMVHWKKAYYNMSEAIKHDDGLVVIGYLMSLVSHFDECYPEKASKFIKKMPNQVKLIWNHAANCNKSNLEKYLAVVKNTTRENELNLFLQMFPLLMAPTKCRQLNAERGPSKSKKARKGKVIIPVEEESDDGSINKEPKIWVVKSNEMLANFMYLVEIDKNANMGIERIRADFSKILKPSQEIEIEPFPLSLFDLDLLKEGYITYLGSLTTPPCSESVIWILSVHVKDVTIDELESFRKLQLDSEDDHNYRPTQPLQDRSIFYLHESLS